jgi:RimJ/RimL family protein N-acetyltransferase
MRYIECDPSSLSEQQWSSYFDCREEIHRNSNPDDPLPSRERRRKYMLNPHPEYNLSWWFASDDTPERIVGMGGLWWPNEKAGNYEESKGTVTCDFVLHPMKRSAENMRGFLRILALKAKEIEKNEIIVESRSQHQFEFLLGLGGNVLSERATNRLYLSEVNWDMIQRWRQECPGRAKNVNLERFSEVPEKDLEQYAKLYTQTWNQAPLEDAAPEFIVTPDSRRNMEAYFKSQGEEWTTIISREQDGTISGLTEIWHNQDACYLVEQGLTGVSYSYRGRGLGKWLKAEMLLYLRDKHPHVRAVEAGNADANAPMLSINQRMGFKPYRKELFMKYQIEQVLEHLCEA